MDYSIPPMGPEAPLLSQLLLNLTNYKWGPYHDPHKQICVHIAKNLPVEWQQADVSCFCMAFPGISEGLLVARKFIVSFCKSHSFLLSLYTAVIPFEVDMRVPVRTELWERYQTAILELQNFYEWPDGTSPLENNIITELQQIMDDDPTISHLGLSALAMAGPINPVSYSLAEAIMSRMMRKCFAQIKAEPVGLNMILDTIKQRESACLPVTSLAMILIMAAREIVTVTAEHVRSRRAEYGEARAFLRSMYNVSQAEQNKFDRQQDSSEELVADGSIIDA